MSAQLRAALQAMCDCHRDHDGLNILSEGNDPALIKRWGEALLAGRAAVNRTREVLKLTP